MTSSDWVPSCLTPNSPRPNRGICYSWKSTFHESEHQKAWLERIFYLRGLVSLVTRVLVIRCFFSYPLVEERPWIENITVYKNKSQTCWKRLIWTGRFHLVFFYFQFENIARAHELKKIKSLPSKNLTSIHCCSVFVLHEVPLIHKILSPFWIARVLSAIPPGVRSET